MNSRYGSWQLVTGHWSLVTGHWSLPTISPPSNRNTAPEVDVTDADANIETQRAGIIDAWSRVQLAQDTLLNLMNYKAVMKKEAGIRALYESIRLLPTSPLDAKEFTHSLQEALETAIKNRLDLRRNELTVENARIEIERRQNAHKHPLRDVRRSGDQTDTERRKRLRSR